MTESVVDYLARFKAMSPEQQLQEIAKDASPTPWTWINSEIPGALEWARIALEQPHCNAVILSRNGADGSFVNGVLAMLRGDA